MTTCTRFESRGTAYESMKRSRSRPRRGSRRSSVRSGTAPRAWRLSQTLIVGSAVEGPEKPDAQFFDHARSRSEA
jgi:hypothetical protein